VSHTAFTICCSCSDMPALGFIDAGIKPVLPPGNAIVIVRCELLQSMRGGCRNGDIVRLTFAEFARRTENAGCNEILATGSRVVHRTLRCSTRCRQPRRWCNVCQVSLALI
jgi:hypothetical protein